MIQPTNDFFTQRRAAVATQVRDLLSVRGPLRPDQKKNLDSLLREADELGRGISREYQQRQMHAFGGPGGFLLSGNIDRNALREERTVRLNVRDLSEAGLATGAATAGGVFVPVLFRDQVSEALKFWGPMATEGYVTTIDTPDSGANMTIPSDDDRSTSALTVAENTQVSMQDVSSFGQTIMSTTAYWSGIVKVSTELLTDSGVNFDAYLAKKFGVRFGRRLNTDFTTGANGFVTMAVSHGNTVAASNPGTSVSTYGSVIALADCAALAAALDPAYYVNASWQCSSATLGVLRAATDKQGNPLFFKGLQLGSEPTIFGRPIAINQAMDSVQTEASSPAVTRYPLAFGDASYFGFRRGPMSAYRLAERFAEFGQIGFASMFRASGAVLDGGGGAFQVLSVTY